MIKLKKNDLVKHDTKMICTVLKTYKDENGQVYVQAFNELGIIYDKAECFEPMDAMLLRCNSCGNEAYETDINVNKENGMYICDCGSSTFTPLNICLGEENINY